MVKELDLRTLQAIAKEIKPYQVPKSVIADKVGIIELLTERTDILDSKSAARRAIKGNAISINKIKITSEDFQISTDNLIRERYIFLDNGRNNKKIIEAV